jgi:hypothetical protein
VRPCPTCGFRNAEGEDFCANCGTYLGWSRDFVPAEEADSDRADSDRAGSEASPAPLAPPALGPVAPTLPAQGEGDRTQPGAVQPAKPVPKRPVVRPAADSTERHGAPCPVCGTPNPPERQFCQHCAAPLRTPATESRRDRPTRRYGTSGRWLRRGAALVALVAAVIAGVALLPAGRNLFEDVRDKLGTTSAVAPIRITANAQQAGDPATALSDGLTNRYWGAPAVGDSAKFTFRAPFRLLDVIIHTGASTEPDEFRQQARAVQLDLVTTGSDGESHTQPVTLNDRPGAQTVQTGISDVVTVRLVIRSAAGLTPGRHIALGEVEFFKRN